jgi:hypothetical protein
MEDREAPRMHKHGKSKTTRIMIATVRHVTFGTGRTKFQTAWFLLHRVYVITITSMSRPWSQPVGKHNYSSFLDSWPLEIEPIGCPETSEGNCHYWLRNNPEERSSQLLRGGSLTSSTAVAPVCILVQMTVIRSSRHNRIRVTLRPLHGFTPTCTHIRSCANTNCTLSF